MLRLPEPRTLCLKAKSFKKMRRLRLLIFRDVDLSNAIAYLPSSLRFINLPRYKLATLPFNSGPKQLVKLEMPYSEIHQLGEGFKNFEYLKVVNLSHCKFLTKIPDLSTSPNLECLFLDHCTNVAEVHESAGNLTILVKLDLRLCVMFLFCIKRIKGEIMAKIISNNISDNVTLKNLNQFLKYQVEVALPGDNIPDWFSRKKFVDNEPISIILTSDTMKKLTAIFVCVACKVGNEALELSLEIFDKNDFLLGCLERKVFHIKPGNMGLLYVPATVIASLSSPFCSTSKFRVSFSDLKKKSKNAVNSMCGILVLCDQNETWTYLRHLPSTKRRFPDFPFEDAEYMWSLCRPETEMEMDNLTEIQELCDCLHVTAGWRYYWASDVGRPQKNKGRVQSREDESQLVHEIVKATLSKLNRKILHVTNYPVRIEVELGPLIGIAKKGVRAIGTIRIAGIMLKLLEQRTLYLNDKSLKKMERFRLLVFDNVVLSTTINCVPNDLRFIEIPGYQFPTFTFNCGLKQLVILSMPHSHIREFGKGFRSLNLENCNLSEVDLLVNPYSFSKLESLNLARNKFLRLPSFRKLFNLSDLNLSKCELLWEIPELPQFVLKLDASDCKLLVETHDQIMAKIISNDVVNVTTNKLQHFVCLVLESTPTKNFAFVVSHSSDDHLVLAGQRALILSRPDFIIILLMII
ncbi:hypothetical protein FEM48_Zijuj05G0174300 [Ziziphus jujuba var. spinosa]|uniref:Uncharacterized protein n=1 Tax=Ziziphus jujuba var. spinosa TaxID=714518 RepID=A0A978VG54_ZIZJJ|nr:hypothetical protein FEM48_Zijuj05G0174300 [Ziziphus jujuba var. spinosa]